MARIVTVMVAQTGARADVRLDDPGLTIAALIPHLRRLTAATATTLTRGGATLAGEQTVADLTTGDVLVLGDAVSSEPPAAAGQPVPAAPAADGNGIVLHHRAPRLTGRLPAVRIAFPPTPQPTPRPRLPLLSAVVPLVAGVVLAAALKRWEFLAFAAMSPLVVIAQAVSDRWAARRTTLRGRADHAVATAAAEAALASALDAERTRRHAAAPDLATLSAAARARTTQLWQRGPEDDDLLLLRLGLGDVPADVVADGRDGPHLLGSAPVVVDLSPGAIVSVYGDDHARSIARGLLVQAVTLHGPSVLAVTVLAPGRVGDWSWTRWLPHVRLGDGAADVAFDEEQLRRRLDAMAPTSAAHLVVIDGACDVHLAAALAARPRTALLWVGADAAHLPSDSSTIIEAAPWPQSHATVHRASGSTVVAADAVPIEIADDTARALAPLRDRAGSDGPLPVQVDWADLNQVSLSEPAAAAAELQRRWAAGPTMRLRLGAGHRGIVDIDLHRDGPHMLVAGTTGAGKSELLQSLVAGLVANCSPTDLCLLLLDFKGGAAFGDCARLPHTLDVLTDLDAAATTRVLRSLTAELRRRERLFAAAGAADLDAYRREQQRRGVIDTDVPRLVLVVDEFATLAEELPDFVGGLVGIAQRGRSLGIHLVLATQRPEGAVSPDIRANARLRLCLAVARESESRDVIDSPVAASISTTTPGRAWLRVDGRDLVELQVPRVSGPAHRHSVPRLVPLCDWDRATTSDAPPDAPSQLERIVDAAIVAADVTAAPAPIRPWLPPLPEELLLRDLSDAGDRSEVAIGLMDLPDELRQASLTLPAEQAETLLVAGGPRSGRTTAAVAVAVALAGSVPPDRLHLWAIDGGGGLGALRDLPHTGAVIDVHDIERVERLLGHLTRQVQQRRTSDTAGQPQLLLLVDTWDALVAASNDNDTARCQDMLLRLAADGPSAGLRVVVTSDRAGLTGRLAAVASDKICLRLPDRADYALLGVAPKAVPTILPAGRGLLARDTTVVQLGLPDSTAWQRASNWPASPVSPRRFHALPTRVALDQLGRAGSTALMVGIRTDDLRPVGIDPSATGTFLIAGPPGSGRSTALVTLAAQARHRSVVAICGRSGPLRTRRDLAEVIDADDASVIEAALHALSDNTLLLVDDVEGIDDPRSLAALESAVRAADGSCGLVVLAGATDAMTASFRGPIAYARRRRCGLLLHPQGAQDGDLLGLRLRRRDAHGDPPGRGLLAMAGRAVAVQVADPG